MGDPQAQGEVLVQGATHRLPCPLPRSPSLPTGQPRELSLEDQMKETLSPRGDRRPPVAAESPADEQTSAQGPARLRPHQRSRTQHGFRERVGVRRSLPRYSSPTTLGL